MRLAILLMLLAGIARAEERVTPIPTAVATQAAAAPVSVSSIAEAWGHSGFLYAFSASQWTVFNGSPLAYTPFELGYAFSNGARIQSGIDLLFYEGKDVDEKHPEKGAELYSYEMSNWRTSLLYRAPLDIRLRPLFGVSANLFGGSRKLAPSFQSGKDINAGASKISAWSYIGIGVQLGLEYLLSADWSLQLSERYDFNFTNVPSPWVTQLGVAVTF